MKRIKDFFEALFTYLLFLSPVIIIALICIVYAYALIKYGNSRVSDIPVWAYFILRGGK